LSARQLVRPNADKSEVRLLPPALLLSSPLVHALALDQALRTHHGNRSNQGSAPRDHLWCVHPLALPPSPASLLDTLARHCDDLLTYWASTDSICPFCYVGKRRIEEAIRRSSHLPLSFNIKFAPFLLDPTLPDSPGENKRERYQRRFGGADKVAAMEKAMFERGQACDPPIRFSYDGNVAQTTDSHRIIEKAYELKGEEGQLALVERCVSRSSSPLSSSPTLGPRSRADSALASLAASSRRTSRSRATPARTSSSRATPSARASLPRSTRPRRSSRPTSSSRRSRRASRRRSCAASAACRSRSSTTSTASAARRRPRRSWRSLRRSPRASSRRERDDVAAARAHCTESLELFSHAAAERGRERVSTLPPTTLFRSTAASTRGLPRAITPLPPPPIHLFVVVVDANVHAGRGMRRGSRRRKGRGAYGGREEAGRRRARLVEQDLTSSCRQLELLAAHDPAGDGEPSGRARRGRRDRGGRREDALGPVHVEEVAVHGRLHEACADGDRVDRVLGEVAARGERESQSSSREQARRRRPAGPSDM